jgi:hypothetical protein
MALKHFSHFRNSTAATNYYEVVSPAQFEVDLKFPTELGSVKNVEVIFEHVRSISGLDGVTPTVGSIVQKYKYAERHYAAAGPDKTSLELAITFTLNLDNNHENYIYTMLRKWYDTIYNPQNGQSLLKKNYADGSKLTIVEYDRDGSIWRRITCFNVFPSTPPTGLNEDNYDSVGDAKTLSITFIVDDWVEETIGMEQYRDANRSGDIDESYYNKNQSTSTGGQNLGNALTNKK